MKVTHNVALSVSETEKSAFSAVGVELDDGFSNFKIDESDHRWPEVKLLIERFQASDVPTTRFSKKEIAEAKHFKVMANNHQGYPEPSDDFGYLETTYDTSDYCEQCGCGLKQKAPFQLGARPKLGKRHFFSLNWVFDELFVLKDVGSKILKEFDINLTPAIDAKSGRELDSVAQIEIPKIDLSLDVSGFKAETCARCGRQKYEPISKGYIPPLEGKTSLHLFKPEPYFGSGANAHRPIIMSAALHKKISEEGLKGLDFAVLSRD